MREGSENRLIFGAPNVTTSKWGDDFDCVKYPLLFRPSLAPRRGHFADISWTGQNVAPFIDDGVL
jgi:hypothetical protein